MKKIDKDVLIIAILCITILEIVALLKGFNGLILTAVIAVIAGSVGIAFPQPKFISKK